VAVVVASKLHISLYRKHKIRSTHRVGNQPGVVRLPETNDEHIRQVGTLNALRLLHHLATMCWVLQGTTM